MMEGDDINGAKLVLLVPMVPGIGIGTVSGVDPAHMSIGIAEVLPTFGEQRVLCNRTAYSGA